MVDPPAPGGTRPGPAGPRPVAPAGRSNMGPAVAGHNRAALVDAAEQLFAEHGYDVPLSAVARAAGVGQGSLYRHFPTRKDLAAAVVARTMDRLRGVATEHPGPEAFTELWRLVVDQLVYAGGFLDAALGPRGEVDGTLPSEELAALLAGPLAEAAGEGVVDEDLTVPDVMLVLSMVHGAVHRLGDEQERRTTAHRALRLVGRGLALPDRA